MALNNDAVFPQDLVSAYATTSAAVGSATSLTPSNTVSLIVADATNGTQITSITAVPRETAAANVLSLYGSKDGGTNKYLITQMNAPAQTISTTAKATPVDFGFTFASPVILAPGETLYVGQMVANPTSGYVWTVRGRDM